MHKSHTGSNIVQLLKTALEKLSGILHVKYFVRTLYLPLQRALKLALVAHLLGRVRRAISFFRHSQLCARGKRTKIGNVKHGEIHEARHLKEERK